MNVNYLANTVTSIINPNDKGTLVLYKSQNNRGARVEALYYEPIVVEANVQPANTQELKHSEGYAETKIYKNFYINKDLRGFNLGLGIGRSKIIYHGIEFLFAAVKDDFKTGWTCITGVQNTDQDRS